MNRAHRYVTSLALAAAFAAPLSIGAAPAPGETGVQVRIYDRNHKDYHDWDDRERHSWGLYLSTNHRHYHDYKRSSRHEQEEYWNWRHGHPDEK